MEADHMEAERSETGAREEERGMPGGLAGMPGRLGDRMRLVHDCFQGRVMLGLPVYRTPRGRFNILNWWAFFLGPLCYLQPGMFRKCLLMCLAVFAWSCLVVLAEHATGLSSCPAVDSLMGWMLNVHAFFAYYYDKYRAKVLHRKFWW